MSHADREPTLQEQIEACEYAAKNAWLNEAMPEWLRAAARTLRELQTEKEQQAAMGPLTDCDMHGDCG